MFKSDAVKRRFLRCRISPVYQAKGGGNRFINLRKKALNFLTAGKCKYLQSSCRFASFKFIGFSDDILGFCILKLCAAQAIEVEPLSDCLKERNRVNRVEMEFRFLSCKRWC